MEKFRSRSCVDERTQNDSFGSRESPLPSYDLRSYSTSRTPSYSQKEINLKRGKSMPSFNGRLFGDPEFQRKKRVAGYKVYSAEGKVKGSFRKSFKWIKDRYTEAVYGWW